MILAESPPPLALGSRAGSGISELWPGVDLISVMGLLSGSDWLVRLCLEHHQPRAITLSMLVISYYCRNSYRMSCLYLGQSSRSDLLSF